VALIAAFEVAAVAAQESGGAGLMWRKPDVVIGDSYLQRWHLVPRNRLLNVYLHRFTGSDDDRALHDHPWPSMSLLLRGGMTEHFRTPGGERWRTLPWLRPVFRRAEFAHRLALRHGPAWTLFITGPKVREWGFLCAGGWRHWSAFTDETGQRVGRGCD
jgi:hypothetical protein